MASTPEYWAFNVVIFGIVFVAGLIYGLWWAVVVGGALFVTSGVMLRRRLRERATRA